MTIDEANGLAIRYKNIWRGGPATEELREHFAEMTRSRAELMLNSLAKTREHPPTIAQLWHAYESTGEPVRNPFQPPDYSDAVAPPWTRAGQTRDEWIAAQRPPRLDLGADR